MNLFLRLKRDGYQLALASSSNEQDLEEYKRIAGIADLLEAQTSSDDAKKSKPHPDIFDAALKQLGSLQPMEAIVIGDTPYDAASREQVRDPRNHRRALWRISENRIYARADAREIFRDPADILERYEQSPFAKRQKAA